MVTRTVRPVHTHPQVNSSQLPWKCSYHLMPPAASGAGTQLCARTLWIFLSPDVAAVCAVTSVHWWVSPREVTDFVFVQLFVLTRAGVMTFQAPYMFTS